MYDGDHLLERLTEHLARSARLSRAEAAHVVREVIAFMDESPDAFVTRRHAELQARGWHNPQIYARLKAELAALRFKAPEYSERQLRRLIYG